MALVRISKILVTDCAGKDVLSYLCRRFTYHDEARWREEIAAGRVLLAGAPAQPGQLLEDGMELEYRPEPRPEPPVDFQVELLAEDDDYLALNKTGNLPCHPGGCFFNHTLWALLKEGGIAGAAPMEDIHFVSRLDRETSGVILIGKTPRAARMAARAMQAPTAKKQYWALVEGDFPDALDADGWLFSSPEGSVSKKRHFSVEKPVGIPSESARTEFRCLGRSGGVSWLSAELHTGRMHQIRGTLCSLGYPVVGDKLYGVDETCYLRFISDSLTAEDRKRLRMGRQALHARQMVVPLRDRLLTFTAPVPGDWLRMELPF